MARNSYLNQLNRVQELRAEVASLMEEKIRIIGAANTQLNQVNRQQINLRSDLDTVKEAISYRTILAPIDGTIFDSKVAPYSVVNPRQVLLKIVPDNLLQAKVDIRNTDSDLGTHPHSSRKQCRRGLQKCSFHCGLHSNYHRIRYR